MYFTTNIITDIKSRQRVQPVHVSCVGEIKNQLKTFLGYSKRKMQLEGEVVLYKKMLLEQIS
jgi:hypothetical protein